MCQVIRFCTNEPEENGDTKLSHTLGIDSLYPARELGGYIVHGVLGSGVRGA